jgi:uncharacterized protein YhfF
MRRSASTAAFWAAYRGASNTERDDYAVVVPGDSPELAAELISLMARGRKRATASLARDFEAGGEPRPEVGGHVVVVDPDGVPRLIWRTTEVRTGPLTSVDDAFAFDEGESDRTRRGWLDAHRRYFARQAAREGFAIDDDVTVVFERFTVVWPPELAD